MKKLLSFALTLTVLLFAGYFGYKKYEHYMKNPWTRDGQVRSQVVQITPRVSGMVIKIHVQDNQEVHTGDLLFEIDPSSYKLKLKQAQARLERSIEVSRGYKTEYKRLKKITKKDRGAVSQKDLIRSEV
ncbi:MAG: efflux transporter periplasmic adaptor subunit, partial [Desulfobulbus sp.]